MDDLKRKYREVVALYKLETEIKDVFVEGNTDKLFIETFLRNKKRDRKILLIDSIDFSELSIEYFEKLDRTSNKTKAIILSKILNENLPFTKVRCLVDKDFNNFITSLSYDKLIKTDFSCLESYLFCEDVIKKFLDLGIGNFPFKADFVISQLTHVLRSLYCLRLLREKKFRSAKLVDFDKNLLIDKEKGLMKFDEEDYLNKFISKNNFLSISTEIKTSFTGLKIKFGSENRDYMNGHDFMKIFFLYINKIKNTPKYKEENFSKILFLTVETQMFEEFPLFKILLS